MQIKNDLNNIENPDAYIKYKEIQLLQNQLLLSNEQKVKQRQIYESQIRGLAHDIKTPLSVIQIYTESLLNNKLEVTRDLLVDFQEESQKIEQLIPKFIEIEYLELPYQQDISLYIQKYTKRYGEIFETKEIKFVTQLEPLKLAISDKDLERLIEHLTFNAFYYSKQGAIIKITVQSKDRKLIIEDEGIGMSEETVNKILNGSYRSDEAKLFNEKSSGIGYQIIRDIVKRLHAHLRIESTIGVGTKVILDF